MNDLKLAKTHDFLKSDTSKLTAVFIHGIASSSESFKGVLEYLEGLESLKDVRFVTFDLLGSGKSLKSDELEYNYDEQIKALYNSLNELDINTPLVLVGHSMGTLIVTRFASEYPTMVAKLVLVSPPVFTERDLDDPAFDTAMKAFEDMVSAKGGDLSKEKAFKNSVENIVKNRENYQTLANTTIPTVLIYGEKDQLIGQHNYKRVLSDNSLIRAEKTDGKHSVTQDKYNNIRKSLEEELNA